MIAKNEDKYRSNRTNGQTKQLKFPLIQSLRSITDVQTGNMNDRIVNAKDLRNLQQKKTFIYLQ